MLGVDRYTRFMTAHVASDYRSAENNEGGRRDFYALDPASRARRFWVDVHGSPVRLALRDGEAVSFGGYYRHEEGWSSWLETIRREGACLIRECDSDGRDCDGGHSRGRCDVAPIPLQGSDDFPEWSRLDTWGRDEYAEAAGY